MAAAPAQGTESSIRSSIADRIENDIDAARPHQRLHGVLPVAAAIHHFVGTRILQCSPFRRSGGNCDDAGAQCFAELDRRVADTTSRAEHQERLPGDKIAAFT
ncbi:hypothetical protein D9M68_927210 [compost metagenome]